MPQHGILTSRLNPRAWNNEKPSDFDSIRNLNPHDFRTG